MRKFIIIFFLFTSSLLTIGQETMIQGRIINSENQNPVAAAKVIRMDSLFDVSSDKNGFFRINVPEKGKINLLFTHPDYLLQTREITPELVRTPILVSLTPSLADQPDSIFTSYKNTLAVAPVELLFLSLTLEYERRLKNNHAVGVFSTALFNQGLWMYNVEVRIAGFKIEPFYRYYAWKKGTNSGFGQVKLVYANFKIIEDDYHEGKTETPGNAFGIGLAWGWKFMHARFKRHSIQIVLGAKFVPYFTQGDKFTNMFNDYHIESWWNVYGPGAIFDVKFTLGGIF